MPTTIRYRRDGVVHHMHPVRGSAHPEGRWHQPGERHPTDPHAHALQDAEHPYIQQGSGIYPISWERRSLYISDEQVDNYLRALAQGPSSVVRRRSTRTPRDLMTGTRPTVTIETTAIPVTDRKFGVEMECITDLPAFITACRNRGITVTQHNYTHETPAAGTWMAKPDGSLAYSGGRAGFRTIEIVSPILQGEAGMRALKLVCEAHAEVGTIVNRTCGLHVHHDAGTVTAEQAKRIARSYHNIQPVINSLVSASRRGGNTYCAPFTDGDMRQINLAITMRDFSAGIGRYKNLNIGHAYNAHKTIEFRQHQGTVDYEKITAWIQLGQAIFNHAVNGMTLQPTTSIAEMAQALGLSSELTSFLEERKLKLAAGGL